MVFTHHVPCFVRSDLLWSLQGGRVSQRHSSCFFEQLTCTWPGTKINLDYCYGLQKILFWVTHLNKLKLLKKFKIIKQLVNSVTSVLLNSHQNFWGSGAVTRINSSSSLYYRIAHQWLWPWWGLCSKKSIKKLNLDCRLYNTHSFRIGRCSDLLKMGVPIEKIKLMGRWKSNAVFKYVRQ